MERLPIWLSAVGERTAGPGTADMNRFPLNGMRQLRLQRRSSSALYRGIQTKRALVHHSTTLMCHCEERSDVAISGRHLQPVQAIADRMQYCMGGDSRARRCTCARNRLPLKWQTPKVCHCEETNGRRGDLGKALPTRTGRR